MLGVKARARVSEGAYELRYGDEADAADRERTMAMPAGSDACQRVKVRKRKNKRALEADIVTTGHQ